MKNDVYVRVTSKTARVCIRVFVVGISSEGGMGEIKF